MSRLFSFLKRERIYILLLVFVSILTVMIMVTPSDKAGTSAGDRAKPAAVRAGENIPGEVLTVERVLAKDKHLALVFTLIALLVIALFLLGVVLDFLILSSRRAGANRDISAYRGPKASWGLWDVSKTVILYVFFSYLLLIAEASLLRVFPALKDDNFRMILNTSIMDTLIVMLILHFTVIQYKEKIASLGLSLKNFFMNVYYGVVAYIALLPVLIGIIAIMAVVMSLIGYYPQKQPVVDLFLREKNAPFLLYTSLFASVAGPVIEEIFFRGFLYNAVKKNTGIFWATLITAVGFALLHAHPAGFLPILALGILLARLYERTGTIVSSVTVHVIHNMGMVLLVFLVKQLGVY